MSTGSPSPLPCEGQDETLGLGIGGNRGALARALWGCGPQSADSRRSIPSQGRKEMSCSPRAPALGLAVLLEQEVARSEATFR